MNDLIAGLLGGLVFGVLLGWIIARRGAITPVRLGLVESVLSRIKERAERELEGEEWGGLALYVVVTISELEK